MAFGSLPHKNNPIFCLFFCGSEDEEFATEEVKEGSVEDANKIGDVGEAEPRDGKAEEGEVTLIAHTEVDDQQVHTEDAYTEAKCTDDDKGEVGAACALIGFAAKGNTPIEFVIPRDSDKKGGDGGEADIHPKGFTTQDEDEGIDNHTACADQSEE